MSKGNEPTGDQTSQQEAVEVNVNKGDVSTGDEIKTSEPTSNTNAQNKASDGDELRDDLSTLVRDHLDQQAMNDVLAQAPPDLTTGDKSLTEIKVQEVKSHPEFQSFVKTFEHNHVPFENPETWNADLDAFDQFMTTKVTTYKAVMLDAIQSSFWKTYVEHMCSVHGAEPEIYSSVESLEEGDIEEEVSSWVFFVSRKKDLQQLLSPDGATMIFISEIQNMVSESLFKNEHRESFENMLNQRLFTLKTTAEEDSKRFQDWLNDMPNVSDVEGNTNDKNDCIDNDADVAKDPPSIIIYIYISYVFYILYEHIILLDLFVVL